MRCSSIPLAVVAVLGGCRIDPPSADAYGETSTGSGSSGTSTSTVDSSGGSGNDVGSSSGGSSSDDGSMLTLGLDATETTGTTGIGETTGTTGDESSSGGLSPCGDGRLDPGEACDDGSNDGSYGGCMPGCMERAEHCGDAAVNGPEACDDGVNDGSYGGCMPDCLVLAHHCGDWVVNGSEACDDGLSNGSYGGCAVGCTGLAEHCGDGVVNGPEVCDDGVNDAAYGNCGLDCLIPPAYCGDGFVNGPETCDDGNLDSADGCFASCEAPTSCVDIKAYDGAAPDGAYVIDPDGGGGSGPFEVYCNMSIDGGGWQLVSVRYQDIGVLFADAVCTGLETDCSGAIPDAQVVPGMAPDLLFATTDGIYWLRLTGLNPPGSDALLDVITLDRVLADTDDCDDDSADDDDHYCGLNLDTGLMVAASSPGYVPRYLTLPSQYVRHGGIWLGNGGGGYDDHVVSLNYGWMYCNPSGLQLSDASDLSLGNVTCTQPGALYFRY